MVVTSCRYLLASLLVSSATAFCSLPAMRSSSPVFAAPVPKCLLQTSQTIHMSAAAAMPNHELSAPSTSKLGRILTGFRFLFAAVFSVVSLYPPLLCSVVYGYLSDNSRSNLANHHNHLLRTLPRQPYRCHIGLYMGACVHANIDPFPSRIFIAQYLGCSQWYFHFCH